ncbi:hypothetical protein [Nocardioides ultimimeridianus]
MDEPTITRAGVVAPVRPDVERRDGRPSPQQVRGKGWRRVAKGLYVPAEVDATDTAQRIVEAIAGLPGAAVTGWAALWWMGEPWSSGVDARGSLRDVPVSLGDRRQCRPRSGVRLAEDWLFSSDVLAVDGLPVTVAERSVSFEARRAWSLDRAVQVIDMAAARDLIDLEGLGEYVARLPARPGIKQLRTALSLADENVWSPMESTLRVLWRVDARRPRPLCNRPVFDLEGRHLLTPDLFDADDGVAGEYDGAVHESDSARRRDLDREERARAAGIEVVTMMAGDLASPGRFLSRLRAAWARAEARRGEPRRWTIEMPPGWVDTTTVAARRAAGRPLRRT